MKPKNDFHFTNDVILYPLLFVAMLWIVFWVESRYHLNFNSLGIYPRTLTGLRGILFSPFVHGSLEHIFNNTVPLFVLSTALFYFYRNVRWKVLLFGLLLTGLATWLIGRPANHIGASGVIYMLVAFLFFKGLFSKHYQLTALSLVVVFLYGGLVWYLFPIDSKISWEGHTGGFVVGLILAFVFKKNPVEDIKYEWQREDYKPEEDDFLQHFDDEGNFIEKLHDDEVEEEILDIELNKLPEININYHFKKKDNDE